MKDPVNMLLCNFTNLYTILVEYTHYTVNDYGIKQNYSMLAFNTYCVKYNIFINRFLVLVLFSFKAISKAPGG